jgi:ATP-dependent Lon protease
VSEPNKKRVSLEDALGELPLFPLSQVVLFPRALLPLHVFEPRYRKMLADVMDTHGALAVVLVPEPSDIARDGRPRIAQVAGAGVVIEHQRLPDGRSNILVSGRARVRLEELPFVPPYRRARATILHDRPATVSDGDRAALVAAATAFIAAVRKREPTFSFDLPPGLEPGALADLCAQHLVIDAGVRQEILEELDPRARVQQVTEALAAQHAVFGSERPGALN